ncbi:MAG: hypothetical protein M9962_15310 [Oligoflexia bacterium]|nr:hypothetical protein [Oligoflexia bacterium]
MKKIVFMSLMALVASVNLAKANDLDLPGEKWLGVFDKYVCEAFGDAVSAPRALDEMNVRFEQITTDYTLDHALLKGTFTQAGKLCRYNAILLADNAAQTSQLVQSIAYDPEGTGSRYIDCNEGKAVLDAAFKANKYLYYGHPHNLAFMLPGVGSEGVCGAGSKTIGANFVVKGKIQPKP